MLPLAAVAGAAGAALVVVTTTLEGAGGDPSQTAPPKSLGTWGTQAGPQPDGSGTRMLPWTVGTEQKATMSSTPGEGDPVLPPRSTEQLENEFAEAVRVHEQAPVDPSWARAAQEMMRSDLEMLGEDIVGFRVQDVDCRTTTCSAKISWNSFDDASLGFGVLLGHRYEENCATRIVLQPPDNMQARYETTLLFDCSKAAASD